MYKFLTVNHLRYSYFIHSSRETAPPKIPQRTSSLTGKVTSREDLLYLAGRKPYSPQGTRPILQANGSPYSLGTDDLMERILDNSSSDDTISILSSASTCTDKGLMVADDRRKMLGGGIGRPSSAPMHRPLARTASDSSRFAHPRHNSSDDTYLSSDTVSESGSDKLRIVRTHSPSTLFVAQSAVRPESPNSPESNLTRTESEKAFVRKKHKPIRSTKSLPIEPVSVVVEDVVDTGLSNITEGKEMSPLLRRSVERESSPGLLERPMSPQRRGNSPGVSPSGSPRLSSRKKRLASKRGSKQKAFSLPETGE